MRRLVQWYRNLFASLQAMNWLWMSTYLDRVRHQVLLPGTDQYLTLSLSENISPQFYIFTNIPSCLALTCSLWNHIKSDYLSIFYANVFQVKSSNISGKSLLLNTILGHFDGLDSGSIPPHIVGIVVSYPMQDWQGNKVWNMNKMKAK